MSKLRYYCQRPLVNDPEPSSRLRDTVSYEEATDVYTHDQCGGFVELSVREAMA